MKETINLILKVIEKSTTPEQLHLLKKYHGHIPQIRRAIQERKLELCFKESDNG